MVDRIPASERRDTTLRSTNTTANTNSANAFNRGQTADEVASQSETMAALPNPMGDVEQPSFHWTFYMGSDLAGPEDTTALVIIAETGKTSLNIVDVEIESIITPNFQTKNMSSYKFKITIVEPLNMSLPDKMLIASVQANVQNFLKAPYLLALDFLGYDPVSGAPKRPVNEQWIWKLFVMNVDTDLDSTGARHTIEAVSYNDIGTFDEHAMLQTPIQIDVSKSEGTVGKILEDLAKQINEALKKSHDVANGGKVPFIVDIKDIPYPRPINVSRPFEHKIVRAEKYKDNQANAEKGQFSAGTDIGRIIDYIMSVSETATQMINPAESTTEDDKEAKEYSTIHRVECEVRNLEYDAIRQDYVKSITYWILAHDSVRPINSAKVMDDAVQAGKKKMEFALQQNYLKKEYQYLFTGKNTEVIDFNINLKFEFKTAAQVMKGFISSELASPGRQFAPDEYEKLEKNTNWAKNTPGQVPVSGSSGGSSRPVGTFLNTDAVVDVDSLGLTNLPLPMSFKQVGDNPSINKSISSTNLRTRSIYGMVMNQLYGSLDANLSSIELVIRGDPYWLGSTNTQGISFKSTETRPNFLNGEHMFLLKFFLPQGIDEEGQPILAVTDMYSGFYAVQKVISSFNDGVFKQTLHAIRIPAMQYSKLLNSGN